MAVFTTFAAIALFACARIVLADSVDTDLSCGARRAAFDAQTIDRTAKFIDAALLVCTRIVLAFGFDAKFAIRAAIAETTRVRADAIDTDPHAWAIHVCFARQITRTLAAFAGLSSRALDTTARIGSTSISCADPLFLAVVGFTRIFDTLSSVADFALGALDARTRIDGTLTVDTDFALFTEHTRTASDTVSARTDLISGALFVCTWIFETLAVDADLSRRTRGRSATGRDHALACHAKVCARAIFVELARGRRDALTEAANLLCFGALDAITRIVDTSPLRDITNATAFASVGIFAIIILALAFDASLTRSTSDTRTQIRLTSAISADLTRRASHRRTRLDALSIGRTAKFALCASRSGASLTRIGLTGRLIADFVGPGAFGSGGADVASGFIAATT